MNKEVKREQIMNAALKLFAKNGFYTTTIPDIAKKLNMSVGNIYNYFKSKDILAQEIIKYISSYLGEKLRKINLEKISTKEKTRKIVWTYFETAKNHPEMIDYFLRVYLSNREVFKGGCEGMICINEFMKRRNGSYRITGIVLVYNIIFFPSYFFKLFSGNFS